MKNKLKNLLNTILFSVLVLLITSCVQSSNYYPSIGNDSNKQPPYLFNEPKIITEDVPEIPTNKKDVDVLVMMYMDGDNGLHNDIWSDLVETVSGYSKLSDGYNVEVVILWDGCVNFRMNRKWQSNSWNYVSKLFRVGKDYSLIDISNNISWLHPNLIFNRDETEVNMNDPKTLENFLSWAKNNYNAETKILQLSDHGTGPGEYGTIFYNRAICQDEGNESINGCLGTKDVPKSIIKSGIGKIDLVIQDVCLGSTIEEVYEYKGVAEYMLLSPNLTPGNGHNYINIISFLSKNKSYSNDKLDIEKYINNVLDDFIDSYKQSSSRWNDVAVYLTNKNGGNKVTDLEVSLYPLKNEYRHLINYSEVSTLTGIKVNEIGALKKSIDNLVNLFETNKSRKIDVQLKNADGELIKKSVTYYQVLNLLMNPQYKNQDFYNASTGRIFDIGLLVDELIKMAINSNWPELQQCCNEIKDVLNNLIFASWRDGVGGALYYKTTNTNPYIKPVLTGTYGIAIAGYDLVVNDVSNREKNKYDTNLKFSKDGIWVKFMKEVKNAVVDVENKEESK